MPRHNSYYKNLNEDERQMVDEFTAWLESGPYARTTVVLYRSLMSKIIVLELQWFEMTPTERTAWYRLEDFLEATEAAYLESE